MSQHDCSEWIFTFGFGHVHPKTGEPLANRFVRIHGNYGEARHEMFRRFGIKWGFQYEAKGFSTEGFGPELVEGKP